MSEENAKLVVSSSPHAHSGASVPRIMFDVVLAMVPAMLAAVYLFGMNAVRLMVVCTVASVITELLCRKAMKRDVGITDWSAVVTGILLAFNLPPDLPSWMAAVGAIFAIGVAKQIFGGLGYNPFNPALIARVALLVSFPVPMTTWSTRFAVDATTYATPLNEAKAAISTGAALPAFDGSVMMDYMIGRMGGCIGEVSAVALLIGAAYLLYRKVITWHTPVFYIATVALITTVLMLINPAANMNPLFHIFTGGLILGAFFMATDMVTTPVTAKGQIVFGVGCGVLTVIIRRWGGYPEGVSFAIILMNAVTPLINRATQPRIFGHSKKK